MIYLNAFLWLASMLSLAFAVCMTVWIWRTRPGATYGPRRTDPVVAARLARMYASDAARIPTGGSALGRGGRAATRPPNSTPQGDRLSLDGRLRDLAPAASR